ncbi:hypothetical protein DSO57_1026776 [Entomophthora muscae]|uniref:Uncharacterized protein n=1 Tax=Entomophthora muscae TaxID=34485 RepID=A0ACC2SEZ4_9FUNG|nr:hypothetical protein DSO57_1026776 [Entomophthora muscae]
MHRNKRVSKSIPQLVEKLRQEGACMSSFSPTLVLCGHKGAGKTSIIEAIAQVKTSLSNDTTSRCPLEIYLSEGGDNDWEFTIDIKFVKNISGTERKETQTVLFQAGICDKGMLREAVQRAQMAALNPTRKPKWFFRCSFRQFKQFFQ